MAESHRNGSKLRSKPGKMHKKEGDENGRKLIIEEKEEKEAFLGH